MYIFIIIIKKNDIIVLKLKNLKKNQTKGKFNCFNFLKVFVMLLLAMLVKITYII